ncbi:MAG: hypothetical protein JO154_24950 [Chitinophaga sp.]|uniref:hypothetical protein n=1 Tax=Chitinophaga sp. TaxID=1869181 RepID=UPI0025C46900|nr:hypothetical protein [Chitinophaga sp.]MBV8255867.1 hypothetical protein [Chitinophaga sp.]
MNKTDLIRAIKIIGIPVAFALIMRYCFGLDSWAALFSVMTIAFLVGIPFGVGALMIYLSSVKKVKSWSYRFFVPWIPIIIFFLFTLGLAIEGWACWLMIMPVFLLLSSIGGLVAGYFKLRDQKRDENIFVSVIVLLPLVISPLEKLIAVIPGTYEAYTYIDIKAPKAAVWQQVTRVKEIKAQQDKGWLTQFLGFPRPLRAELNYEGVGAYREAIFTGGLIFHETVTEYSHQRKMTFDIRANPYEIPSTTMDEHVVVGGDYFDVLNGVYELEQLDANTCRLHLSSHFKLSTTFNFYASWWARWIMKDIQNNILQVVKQRAEH